MFEYPMKHHHQRTGWKNNPSRSIIICNTFSFNVIIEWSLYSLNQHWGLWILYCHIYLLLLERLLICKIWFPITMSLEIISLFTIRQILNNANRSFKKISEEIRQTTIIFHNTTWTTILLQRKLPRHNANLDRKLRISSGRQILLCARSEIAIYKSYILSNNASSIPMIATFSDLLVSNSKAKSSLLYEYYQQHMVVHNVDL